MSSEKPAAPAIILPSLEKSLLEEQNRQLAEIKPQTVLSKEDTGQSAHKLVDPKANFDQKIYMFPESYNALREELYNHWPNLWELVSWCMAFQAEDFVAIMNGALDMKLQVDGNKVDATCQAYLDALRAKRGLSKLH